MDFSFWGYVKHKFVVPLLPSSLEEPLSQITEAFATIDANMIHRIWDEIAYRWDVCSVTRKNHVERL